MDVVAIDWSGRVARAEEHIWLALARDGVLVELENGRTREGVIDEVLRRAGAGDELVVGLDFAFSFPAWFCRSQGWRTGPEVWAGVREHGERFLAECAPPFWGRPGTRAQELGAPLREDEATLGAKSVFQIGGAGAVGTGSIRGMPQLLRLAAQGVAVWPFHDAAPVTAVEIYPRLLTRPSPGSPPVAKSRHRDRRAYLAEHFGADGAAPRQDPVLLERAAGSEDAFDAAVSALVMARHLRRPSDLPAVTDPVRRLEGAIWRPPAA